MSLKHFLLLTLLASCGADRGDPIANAALRTIELPQSQGPFGDIVFVRPSVALRQPEPIVIAVVCGEGNGMGLAYWIDAATGSIKAQLWGAQRHVLIDADSVSIPDRTGDGLPELVCRRNEGTVAILGSDGSIAADCELPGGVLIARVLAVVPEGPEELGLYCLTRDRPARLVRARLERESCAIDWSMPRPLDPVHSGTGIVERIQQLRVLTDASSGSVVALVCMFQSVPPPESNDEQTSSATSLLCVPVDELGHPSAERSVVAQRAQATCFLGDVAFLGEADASKALLADSDGAFMVDRFGLVSRIASAPDGCAFNAAPLHLPGMHADGLFAIPTIERGSRVPLPVHEYQLWLNDEPRWAASIPVMSNIPSCRSIASVPDLDGDGRAETLVARVEYADDDYVDGPWEGLFPEPSKLFVLPGALVK